MRKVSSKAGETFNQRIQGRILSAGLVHQCERIIGSTSVQSDLHGLRIIATACLYRASDFFRVRDLIGFLKQQWGKAEVVKYPASGGGTFAGKKGVILFEVSGWSDAQGHATLFNGRSCYDHGYFNEPETTYRTDRANFWGLR